MIEGAHYQNAYVTRNLVKAVAAFKACADLRFEAGYDGPMPVTTAAGPGIMECKLAFLWVGDLQYEFIEPVAGAIGIYRDALPDDDSPVFHHVAMRVPDWADFRARVARQSLPLVQHGEAGPLSFLYLDARASLGHYLEYTCMPEEMWRAQGGR